MVKNWLHSLLQDMENLDLSEGIEPEGEVAKNEHVVGLASEDCRRLYCVARSLHESAHRLYRDLKELEEDSPQYKELRGQIQAFACQADAAMEIFWVMVKEQYPELYQRPSIGIRSGWQVVWFEKEKRAAATLAIMMGPFDLADLAH